MLTTWLKRFEVPQSLTTVLSRWINNDIRPIEAKRRTWVFSTFSNSWLLTNINISTYLTGSALIPLGLTWWQAIVCIVIGNLLSAFFCVLNSLPGAYYNLGFPVVSRMVWGMWGSQFAIWNRIFLSLVWYGFTAWIGGECVYVILQSWDPNLDQHIPNILAESTSTTSAYFVSYVIFMLISAPFAWIRPHKLANFFYIASTITIVCFLSLLIWALATMGPEGFGDTISSSAAPPATATSVGWLMVYGIVTTTIGAISAGILNQNDYARFAKRPRHAILSQAINFPTFSTVSSVIGILVTAATQNRFGGEAVWSPPGLLSRLIAESSGSTGTRAACCFAAMGLVVSQIGINVPGNALSGGFDLAATFPRYIDIRRGAYITMLLSVVVNPWQLANTSTIFLTVLSSYSVFLGPMVGMMVSSYLVVNKRKINVDDLYVGGSQGIYWYTAGINWRSIVAFFVGCAPLLPGFISAVNPEIIVSVGATNLYDLSFIYGFVASGFVYFLLHLVFPAPALDAFVKNSMTARQTMSHYRQKWDAVDGPGIEEGVVVQEVDNPMDPLKY
ncbi:NCS1 nucleoside transporter family protein [Apiospora sp. TS-2023a]